MSVPSALADATWMTPARSRAYALILLIATLVIAVAWIASATGGVDAMGHPLGTDFLNFWVASGLALAGDAAGVYDPLVHGAREQALFPAYLASGYTPFLYPPMFLLVCLPLALLPYFWSLAAWVGVTFAAYWWRVRALLPGPGAALPIVAFPAVLITAGHGQNAFLTAALFATGARWLGARPVLAGLSLGALCIKPHLMLLVPVALLLGGRWRALVAAAAMAGGLAACSLLLFGADTWHGFFRIGAVARGALEGAYFEPGKMPTVFAALRVLSAPIPLAYVAQGAAALLAVAVLVRVRRATDAEGQIAATVVATAVASPFMVDYDLTIFAVPLAYVFARAQTGGFLRWEKVTLMAAFVLPLIERPLALGLSVPLGPLVSAALLATVARRLSLEA